MFPLQAIQVASYLLLADPVVGTNSSGGVLLRSAVEVPYQRTVYRCRLDMVSASLFQIVLTEFFMNKFILYGKVSTIGQV